MRTLVHLSDLHFGRVDADADRAAPRLRGRSEARSRRRLGRPHPARAQAPVRGGARIPRSPAAAADRRAGQPRRAAVPGLGALPQPARQVPPDRRARPRAVVRRRRDRRGRHQHRALAHLQGRAHQRRADGGDPAPLRPARRHGAQGRRHPSSVRPARPERRRRSRRPRGRGDGRVLALRRRPAAVRPLPRQRGRIDGSHGTRSPAIRRSSSRPARRPRRAAAAKRTRSTSCASATTRSPSSGCHGATTPRPSRRMRPSDSFATAPAGSSADEAGAQRSASWSCSSRHITLPEPDFGSASTNWTSFGTL